MFHQLVKATLVLASSAVVVPYAVALIANAVCGWPMRKNKYRRALNPRKVYSLNYAILLELTKLQFAGLFFRWQRFYNSANMDEVIKNIPFGSNDNYLDVYLSGDDESGMIRGKPVIIFIYGGTWGSGDKSMYGLLCSHLAKKLKAVVVCPNYSIFPKGFVDDMVQDIGEAIQWVKQHIDDFGGNKKEIILLGHSAGAHLAVLTVLELCIKQLARDEDSMLLSAEELAEAAAKGENLELSFVGLTSNSFYFEEQHFNGNEDQNQEDKSKVEKLSQSLMAVSRQGDGNNVSESFCFVEGLEDEPKETAAESVQEGTSEQQTEEEEKGDGENEEVEKKEDLNETLTLDDTVLASGTDVPLQEVEDNDDLLSSIRLVVGLAGVYDITEHFEYESERGVEDISTMARAMYDPKHFQQFSPTFLAKALPPNIRLPPFNLFHGDTDYVVPFSSSVHFGEALWSRGIRAVQVVILPGCGHYNICLDLMETGRQWHHLLLNEIQRSITSTIHVTDDA